MMLIVSTKTLVNDADISLVESGCKETKCMMYHLDISKRLRSATFTE